MAQKGYIKNSLTKDLGAPEMANMFQGIFGASGIMSLYENLACVKVDNNTVRMSAGAYNLSGHLLGIAKGTTEDLTIDSGTSGQNRNDLIVAEFVRNGGGLGVDTLHFTVVKGASTSGTAADPALTQQDINAAGVTRQEALYRVKVTGTEIAAVEKVAGSVSNLNLVQSEISDEITTGVESPTNKYIDGKQVYIKRIETGALPNATSKNVAHGLNLSLIRVVSLSGNSCTLDRAGILPLPHSTISGLSSISLSITLASVTITTGTDRTNLVESFVEIEYYYL